MEAPSLEFWFEFASPYSYVASTQIEALCKGNGVELHWKPFLLGPVFERQGWNTSPFNINPLRGAYMWRDMERLAAKLHLPWNRPSVFPRKSVLAARVAAAHAAATWIGDYIRSIFIANFGDDAEIEDEEIVAGALRKAGADVRAAFDQAMQLPLRSALRDNTERALALGIFGAPNCLVAGELFWGEEALEDAIRWAQLAR